MTKLLRNVLWSSIGTFLIAALSASSLSGQDPAPAAHNSLTDAEKKAGWTLLFDGKSLSGWRGYKRPDASATRWRVREGFLMVPKNDGKDTHGALDIISSGAYDNFELTFEWRISQGGNSGVKYFVLEDTDAAIGHEFQVADDERLSDAKIGPQRQTAALYDVLPPIAPKLLPAGELNQGRILVNGRHVEHWLNGKRVLEYDLGSNDLRKAITQSKFKDVARFGTVVKGHILLQDHGAEAWFRNIKIRAKKPA